MSADRAARSVALEQAYVYDVYEKLDESCIKCGSKPWPRVREFLDSLEAGSLVCDVGSGNGKYLNLNTSVYTIGGDKSTTLCKMTRNMADNEVILLDNLSLPYRDESLDGILSIAVIHHFTTTERRVCALRELARVLRIGGRIIISVWAMEQSSRRFESQDVLVPVPWTLKQQYNTFKNTEVLQDEEHIGDTSGSSNMLHYQCSALMGSDKHSHISNKSSATSATKKKVKPNNSSSPVSSTLCSPNETCYSFVRKAIQKLAGGRPSTTSNQARRPWFLHGWGNCAKDLKAPGDEGRRYDPDGCECCCDELTVQDLPIELRRIDDDLTEHQEQRLLDCSASELRLSEQNNHQKSQSMSNMSNTTISTTTINVSLDSNRNNSIKQIKPKLVKQKQSICHDDCNTEEAMDQHTDMLNVRKQRPVLKQRSLNEEYLMNTNARTVEKEKLKHHFHKQTSLNDDLIYQQHTDHSRDSFFFTKRLHLIKNGFTNKLKTSTTNIEKVAAGSFKNGFVRILQNWNISSSLGQQQQKDSSVELQQQQRDCADGCERRLSREEGSDSSKDSSLQSDTSVDSEDSFASVIFIPKSNSISPTLSSGTLNYSMPNTKIKQSSCPTSPQIRQIPLSVYSPLMKQLSSPKPNTKDSVLILQQITMDVPHDSSNTLATKYSVQQIPKFNNKNSASEAAVLPRKKALIADSVDKPNYPLVRHMSLYSGRFLVKPLPKLLSLELFNPETDDKDSDSSAVSSPDSVDSVLSGKDQQKRKFSLQHHQQKKLLQAALDVVNSLDNAVNKVVHSKQCNVNPNDIQSVMERAFCAVEPEPWNKDCHQHLTDFADRLAAKLQLELCRYQNQGPSGTSNIDFLIGVAHEDPYIHRLSEELYDLSKLSEEIQKQNEYLAKLSVNDNKLVNENKCKKCKCKHINCDKSSSSSGNIASKNNIVKVNTLSIESSDSKASSSSSSIIFGGLQSVESTENSAYSGSTASLVSWPEWKNQRNILQNVERSPSADTNPKSKNQQQLNASDGASQESLPSDGGTVGGEITYHRFYHVFRERELDQLIEKYVENLHIISSYYDHASWCIVAEKVHVWTI